MSPSPTPSSTGKQLPRCVPVDQVRAHVNDLLGRNPFDLNIIAALAGTSTPALTKLINAPTTRTESAGATSNRCSPVVGIRQDLAYRLLQLGRVHDPRTSDRGVDQELVDGTGTRRRLQAMAFLGWTSPQLAAVLGLEELGTLSDAELDIVPATLAARVVEVYARLWQIPPPARTVRSRRLVETAKAHARRQRWVSALAWDDETIDDPEATPSLVGRWASSADLDEVVVLRFMTGTARLEAFARSPERIEAIRRLAQAGLSDSEIGERLDTSASAICRVRVRHAIASGVPALRITDLQADQKAEQLALPTVA